MKKSYLILLIVIGLFTLALYSTYAMFTMSVETDDFVNLSASSLPTETQILEYERITINAKDTKIIDFNISNNTTSNLYYGAWYEMVEPTSINDNIIIAKYVDSESETFGSIDASSKKKVTLAVSNNTDSSIIINIGVAYSETSSLNLPTNRNLITDVYTPNLDSSGANAPKLVDNMIPVMYNEKTLVKADSKNSDETTKYIDTYAMGIYDYAQSAMNRARLGDATGEVMSTASRYGGWYNDYATFVNYDPMPDMHLSWFYRGGLYSDGSNAGVFYFSSYHGNTGLDYSTRATLLAF